MSRKIRRVSIQEFTELVNFAVEMHYMNDEPIPQLRESEFDRLESCLNTPFQKYFGVYFYRGFLKKASILFYLLNRNHVLLNGNKRMACLCLGYFCFKNGYDLIISEDIFYQLAREVVMSDENQKNFMLGEIRRIIGNNLQPTIDTLNTIS
ncbi:MAG TPA: Fic family protein [Puia sp.]|nr:Fic family protein [Puia sp.]